MAGSRYRFLSADDGRKNPGKIGMHDFESVAIGLAEANGGIDVQAGRLSVLDKGKRDHGGIRGDPKDPVRRLQVIQVRDCAL